MMPAWLRDNFNKMISPNKDLATEAGKLEALATKLENEASLRERIKKAKERIQATQPEGHGKFKLPHIPIPFILVGIVVVVLLIAKAC